MKSRKIVITVLLILAAGLGWYFVNKTFSAKSEHQHKGESEHNHMEHACSADEEDHCNEEANEHSHDHEGEGTILHLSDAAIKEFGVETAIAERGTLQVHISLPAEIAVNADKMAHIVPQVPGTVKAVNKNIGDQVKAGEVLAVIQSRELADIKAAYLAAKEKLSLAQSTYEREELLWKKKISAEIEYLEAKRAMTEALIDVRSLEQKLHSIGFSEEYISSISQLSEEFFVRFEVQAPMDGTIIEKHIVLGEVLKDDSDIFTIADLNTVWANINVHQKDLNKIKQGTDVEILLDDFKVEGKINYVSDIVSQDTRTAFARAVIPNKNGVWRPGTFAEARLLIDEAEAEVAVPKKAIVLIDGKTCIFIKTEEGFEPQEINVGRTNDVNAEILTGIQAGQLYVTKGASILKSEMKKSNEDPCGGH